MVEDLAADDFRELRATLAKTRGPAALGTSIQIVRMVFKFAYDEGLLDRPVRYGQSFVKPSKKVLRKQRATNGKRMFEAIEIRLLLKHASEPLRTIILLGINCGLGNTDASSLPRSALDLKMGWMTNVDANEIGVRHWQVTTR